MVVPSNTRQEWKDILTGKKQFNFEFLAARMTIGRLQLTLKNDSSLSNLQQCATELHEVFVKNINLPKVQRDLTQIFGEGGLS